jgi:hypothetical protein
LGEIDETYPECYDRVKKIIATMTEKYKMPYVTAVEQVREQFDRQYLPVGKDKVQ